MIRLLDPVVEARCRPLDSRVALKSRSALMAVLVSCMALGQAAAQHTDSGDSSGRRSSREDPFVRWAVVWGDPKHEGVYTCDQWKSYAAGLFDKADRNHDRFLDAMEFKAIQQADTMFKEADIGYFDDNRDGRVSRSEFVDKPNPLFVLYDKNGDCKVTFDEIAAGRAK
jgi:hypothetical protein